MSTFRKITKRDNPDTLARRAAEYESLLTEALSIARSQSGRSRRLRELLTTAKVEGLARHLNIKASVISYDPRGRGTYSWHSLYPWQHLSGSSPEHEAEGILQILRQNIEFSDTDSWPKPPAERGTTRPHKKRGA